MGRAFWKENIEDRLKFCESNVLNFCLKITKANLHKIGLKMREWRLATLRVDEIISMVAKEKLYVETDCRAFRLRRKPYPRVDHNIGYEFKTKWYLTSG